MISVLCRDEIAAQERLPQLGDAIGAQLEVVELPGQGYFPEGLGRLRVGRAEVRATGPEDVPSRS